MLGIALYANLIEPVGLIWLLLMLAAAVLYQRNIYRAEMVFAMLALAFGLAVHGLPGFNNPSLLSNVQVSTASSNYSVSLGLDKFSAGLFIFWFVFSSDERRLWDRSWLKAVPVLLFTLAASIGIASLGMIDLDIKLSMYLLFFAINNLLFTCMAEEAYFRGLIQKQINTRMHYIFAIVMSALLFGLAHYGAGRVDYVIAAIVAGLGYAGVYHITQSISASMLAHWLLNLVHFVFFTYPFAR